MLKRFSLEIPNDVETEFLSSILRIYGAAADLFYAAGKGK